VEQARRLGPRNDVVFTDGVLTINGTRINMPGRPQNQVVAVVYDVLSLIGVLGSVVLVVAQLAHLRKV
jgi:hypothetical protein